MKNSEPLRVSHRSLQLSRSGSGCHRLPLGAHSKEEVEASDVCVQMCVHVRLGRGCLTAACCIIALPDLQVFSSRFSSL